MDHQIWCSGLGGVWVCLGYFGCLGFSGMQESMEVFWGFGNLGIWGFADLAVWGFGDLRVWGFGGLGIWGFEDLGIWGFGDLGI